MAGAQHILGLIKLGTRTHWFDSLWWFVFTVPLSLLPVWGSAIVLTLMSRPVELSDFMRHGEFALYSAALLGGALYLVARDLTSPFVHRKFFLVLMILTLVVASIAFGSVSVVMGGPAQTSGPRDLILNEQFLRHLSLILFGVSALSSFTVHLLDSIMTSADTMHGMAAVQQKSLEKEFDALEETDAK